MVISMNMARHLIHQLVMKLLQMIQKKMAAIPSGKRVHKTTNPVKEFKGFEIDPTTGFPICPKTKELIDGTKPYCKSCFIFGHSQKLFTGCEIHKDVLACLEKEEEEKTNGNKVDKK